MIRPGLCRTTINARVNRIRRVFRLAASVLLIRGSVAADLKTVEGLEGGHSGGLPFRPIVGRDESGPDDMSEVAGRPGRPRAATGWARGREDGHRLIGHRTVIRGDFTASVPLTRD
jgi:hypothetical protein